MRDLAPFSAVLTDDMQTIVMTREGWRAEVRAETVDKWIAFHRELAERNRGRFKAVYLPAVGELEKIRKQLKQSGKI